MSNGSLSSSIIAPHVTFHELDVPTQILVHRCRIVLGLYSGAMLCFGVGATSALQVKWQADMCETMSSYGTSDSILCEVGLPLYAFATTGIAIVCVMALLGLYGSLTVRRLFLAVYLTMSLAFMLFMTLTFVMLVAKSVAFVPFSLVALLFLLSSPLPVVAVMLLLRFKSADNDELQASPSMLETAFVSTPRSDDDASIDSMLYGHAGAATASRTVPNGSGLVLTHRNVTSREDAASSTPSLL